ncbi:MAG: hypothetical protein IT381_27855 [Deltaproteobacteria bacterium]|nr:hypothetical protein [Deltaproteobacteria bacterium]
MQPLATDVPAAKKRPFLEALLVRIQANASGRMGRAPSQRTMQTATPPPRAATPPPAAAAAPAAPEKIDAFDERWGGPPQKPIAAAPPKPAVAAKPTASAPEAPSGDRAAKLNTLLARLQKNGRRS